MITAQDMERGMVVCEGHVYEGEDVAGVFRWVKHRWPLVGWRTTNKARAARHLDRVARLRLIRLMRQYPPLPEPFWYEAGGPI